MITGIPADTPVTTPVELPIVASAILLLVHVPPEGVEDKVVADPMQTFNVPVMVDGVWLTVNGVVA